MGTVLHQILLALDYVYTRELQIIHRDIKPANIFFRGNDFFLTDFGVAKFVDTSRTIAGSPSYMALETLANQHAPQMAPMLTDVADQRPTARDLLDAFFPQPAHALQVPRNGITPSSFGVSSPLTNQVNGTTTIYSAAPTTMDWTRTGATSFFRGTPRPPQRDENTQPSQANPAAVQSPKVPPNRQPGIRRKGSVKSAKGAKANIKPTAALKIEKHTQGTGDTGIGNGLTSHGILTDMAPATGKGCQNKFKRLEDGVRNGNASTPLSTNNSKVPAFRPIKYFHLRFVPAFFRPSSHDQAPLLSQYTDNEPSSSKGKPISISMRDPSPRSSENVFQSTYHNESERGEREYSNKYQPQFSAKFKSFAIGIRPSGLGPAYSMCFHPTNQNAVAKPAYPMYSSVGPKLGSGQFGTVHKAIDVDSGKFMAVKILERSTRASKQEDWKQSLYYALKREVETLSEISHVEIFMGLKEGTLESLVESGADASAVANSVFPQMLQALDCIAWKGIVHRDVKPENILYISQPDGQYQFQLGDFGLCNRIIDAATFAGTYLYMPPEMLHEGVQTHKVDVWELFVTMMWILDAGEFRQRSNRFKTVAEVQRAVLSAASKVDSEMAIVNPEERASAAQMLVKHFDGAGLTTSPSPTIAAARAPPPAPSSLTTRTAQTKPRGLQMNANVFAAAQYRVEKARDPLQAKPFRRLPEIRPKIG
ncbi:uncharacterized protein PAC_19489 [Phialocephala subalpina]|uniref:non-specific serine/threonine protein kinase n=1 Tax=Phialocephala subalpina TaxID=576137 RepID=A0A1L7XX76_9HELO|nr:uncharacterized protein PAC_19489 [Phialocephala subalpina]